MSQAPGATTRRYLSRKFLATDWTAISEQFDRLERIAASPDVDLSAWLLTWSELEAAIDEERTRRHIAYTCQTDDAAREKAFMEFEEQISPKCKPRWQALKKTLLNHPKRSALDPARWGLLLRSIENEFELFREENIPLDLEDTRLGQQYQKLMGAMTVTYDGKERTLQQMAGYQEQRDRAVRKEAWELVANRRLKDREALDGIYDQMVALRNRYAKNAGFQNFRDFIFRARERWDYTPDDCARFHDAVEKHVVPHVRALHAERKAQLKLDVLRPWDLAVDPLDAPPLKPFEGSERLIEGCREMFRRVHPDFQAMIDTLRQAGNLDLESRKGKAPGGYQTTLEELRTPFIFMNAAGLNQDVFTFLHEGGHAFHSLLAREEPILRYRYAPIEFCEVASMGMELLAMDGLDVFYPEADARRARRKELEGILAIFPWVATVDAFQHWIYTHPDHTRAERTQAWLALRERFGGLEDWTGYEAIRDSGWHRQMHIFNSPFYYIEYGIAQLGALQVWGNKKRNGKAAVESYRSALRLGGTRRLPDLFAAAGASFDLGEKTIRPAIEGVLQELAACR
ncbi:MAG: M3 family oligoendopeptidase [Candidatus Brocadiae bacterium]|nr:M3 family oligoendopeptidase [Candidatus Brocadiia bacterium]